MGRQKIVDGTIIFMGVVLILFLLREFQVFLRPFAFALVLTFLLVPVTRLPLRRKVVVVGCVVAGAFLLGVASFVLGSFLLEQSIAFSQEWTLRAASLNDAVANVSEAFNMGSLEEGATAALSSLSVETLAVKGAGRFVAAVGNFFSEVFLVLLFLVFLLPSHDVIMERVGRGLSRERRRAFFRTLEQIESSVRAYLVTKVLVSVGTALSSFVVMLLFGTKFALVFSVLVFVLNFIPNFGSFIAVATILVFEVVRLGFGWKVVFLAGLLILVQVVWGNILEPKFAARSLELSPIVVLLSLFFWGVVWGVWGLLFAVPLTASIKIILQNIPSTKKIALFLS